MIYLFSCDFMVGVTHFFYSHNDILSSFDVIDNRISAERKYSLFNYTFIGVGKNNFKKPVKLKWICADQYQIIKGAKIFIINHLISEL